MEICTVHDKNSKKTDSTDSTVRKNIQYRHAEIKLPDRTPKCRTEKMRIKQAQDWVDGVPSFLFYTAPSVENIRIISA